MQSPQTEASKFVLLPEGGDHSERVFDDAVAVTGSVLALRHRVPPRGVQPHLPPEFEDVVSVPQGAGVCDDGGLTFSSLISRLPSTPEYFRGRNLAVQRVVCVSLQLLFAGLLLLAANVCCDIYCRRYKAYWSEGLCAFAVVRALGSLLLQ